MRQDTPNSQRKTLLLDEETRKRLEELGKRYGLSFSDSSRRGIEMLYNYLILDKLPDGESVREVLAKWIDEWIAHGVREELKKREKAS